MDWKQIGRTVGSQFGLGDDEPDEAPSALSTLTPEQIRQADIELQAAERGKVVSRTATASLTRDEPLKTAEEIVDASGHVDFQALYTQAGVSPAKFTAESALSIIQDCADSEAARQQAIKIIKQFGKNVGATPDEIVVDAVSKQDALDAYNQQRGNDLVDLQAKIKENREKLQAQLAHLAEVDAQAEAQYNTVRQACLEEHARLESVRNFFRTEPSSSPSRQN